jgi:hypothetical protein
MCPFLQLGRLDVFCLHDITFLGKNAILDQIFFGIQPLAYLNLSQNATKSSTTAC